MNVKLNSKTWMTLKSSIVIFQALKPLQLQWPQQPQQPRWPQWPQQPHFIQQLPEPDGWIIPGTKMTSNGVFCWMDYQKSKFLLVYGTFSVGGCWGQPMLLFLKTGWWNSNSLTSGFYRYLQTKSNLHIYIILKETFQCETPCT